MSKKVKKAIIYLAGVKFKEVPLGEVIGYIWSPLNCEENRMRICDENGKDITLDDLRGALY
ncbi:MAG: hypothetical protein HDR09_12855 [Lachnospiraceae bacterium]|nr:hypothetical protein [Lachnospiraceae bacterium]